MKKAKRTIAQVLLLAAAAVTVATVSVAMAGPSAKCPLIYAPVICDGGKVYSNQCIADQHHAKNCVPYGI
jgi:phage baseplate assembly protein gpV